MKHKLKITSFLSMLALVLIANSCKENKNRTEAEKIVSEWIGKEIQFSKDYSCNVSGKDTVSANRIIYGISDSQFIIKSNNNL